MESKIRSESLSSIFRLTLTSIRDRMTSSIPSSISKNMAIIESSSRVSLLPLMRTLSYIWSIYRGEMSTSIFMIMLKSSTARNALENFFSILRNSI